MGDDEDISGPLGERLGGLARGAGGPIDRIRLEEARARVRASLFAEPREAVRLGRYVVLERIGHGAMGVVYLAFDPQLDRKIALKVMHADLLDAPEREQRLLHEARALAKLAHPNILALHDVGRFDDEGSATTDDATRTAAVFIAMEYVEGLTLRSWLAETRSWVDVLAVMMQAARGLAAAHAVGLVHRDFKPDNVMVGSDGRVRVMDFGLARATDSRPIATATEGDAEGLATFATPQTVAGTVVGTPAYMAPEQFSGAVVGGAADQFAFCVTFWEALYGERPFHAVTTIALREAIMSGKPRPPGARRNVPGWLLRIVERGLSADPERRWPAMDVLTAELERGRARLRRRRVLAAFTAAAVLGGAAMGWTALDRAQRIAACEAEGRRIDSLWNQDRAQNLRDAMIATGLSYAKTTADRVEAWLDLHAQRWAQARTAACLASEVHDEWSTDLRDRSLWCLEERRLGLLALVDELSAPDTATLQRAISAAVQLESIETCIDEHRLSMLPRPPAGEQARFLAVLGTLSSASSLEAAGRYELADIDATTAVTEAQALGWAPLVAAARLRSGSIARVRGESARAEQELEAAYFAAAGSGAVDIAADAAILLSQLVGQTLARPAEGQRWARLADVAFVQLGIADDDHRGAAYQNSLGAIALTNGSFEDARAHFASAVQIGEHILGPDHPDLARALSNLAIATDETGDASGALALLERALSIEEIALGPDHPHIARTLSNIAIVHIAAYRLDEADALLQRALVIRESALGPRHPEVATVLQQLGIVRTDQRRFEDARELHTRALEIAEAAYEPDHPAIAGHLSDLGLVLRNSGDVVGGNQMLERALAIREKTLGPDHPAVGDNLHNLANGLREQGRLDEASAAFQRAGSIWTAQLGADHPRNAWALRGLADTALAAGRADEAVAFAERGLKLRESTNASPLDIAELRFVLARSLFAAGEPARARAEAERARAEYQSVQDGDAAEVIAWLADHPGKGGDPEADEVERESVGRRSPAADQPP